MPDGLYRVEKDGRTFYVQPHMLQYYADNGYKIFRSVEEQVTDVRKEIKSIPDNSQTALIGGDAE